MAEQLVDPSATNTTASRVWFPDGAPFGDLEFVRADHFLHVSDRDSHHHAEMRLAEGGLRVLREAWQSSDWLRSAVGKDRSASFLDGQPYADLRERVTKDIIHAACYPQGKTAWFAVVPARRSIRRRALGDGDGGISPEQVVGFANARNDVSGRNALVRTFKRWRHPEKIYAAVSNVAVDSGMQGQRIGSALFYLSLGMFGDEQHPTVYIETVNEDVARAVREVGYRATSSDRREDLVVGARIEEMRFQADTVAAVRRRMRDELPWLGGAAALELAA